MKINRLKIVNYKLFQNVTIEMNENINIFVGKHHLRGPINGSDR